MTTVQRSARATTLVAPPNPAADGAGSSPLDDAMNRYADGDDSAFAEVFRGLASRVQTFLQRLSGRRDVADDLTQETFLRMHRARGSFARGRSVVPWAYAIARNCYID